MKEQTLPLRLFDLEKEFNFRMSRSSGKGGQHVNKVSTRVELLFDVLNSEILTQKEKKLVVKKLAGIISQNGILQIASQDSKNAKELHDLFFELRKKFNQTFIIVTHNDELADMADRKLTIQDGVIVE